MNSDRIKADSGQLEAPEASSSPGAPHPSLRRPSRCLRRLAGGCLCGWSVSHHSLVFLHFHPPTFFQSLFSPFHNAPRLFVISSTALKLLNIHLGQEFLKNSLFRPPSSNLCKLHFCPVASICVFLISNLRQVLDFVKQCLFGQFFYFCWVLT